MDRGVNIIIKLIKEYQNPKQGPFPMRQFSIYVLNAMPQNPAHKTATTMKIIDFLDISIIP